MKIITQLRNIFYARNNPVITARAPEQELDFLVSKFDKEKYDGGYYINEMRHIYFKQLVESANWSKWDNYDDFRFKKGSIELHFWVNVVEIILNVGENKITVYRQNHTFIDGNWIHEVIRDLDAVIRVSSEIMSEREANSRQVELLEQAIVNRHN